MSILVDETKKVIVQGITGREGMARTKLMQRYGTRVVAGCTPGKSGQDVLGVPVYDTVAEAVERCDGLDVSVIFVPAPLVKDAALEAIAAGIKLLVIASRSVSRSGKPFEEYDSTTMLAENFANNRSNAGTAESRYENGVYGFLSLRTWLVAKISTPSQ